MAVLSGAQLGRRGCYYARVAQCSGIDGEDARSETPAQTPIPGLDIGTLAAQLQQLTQVVQNVSRMATVHHPEPGNHSAAQEAARAAEALRHAQTGPAAPLQTAGWSPSHTFNLDSNSASGLVVHNHNADLELARLLAEKGATPEQIMGFLQ